LVRREERETGKIGCSFISNFGIVLVSEMGDKTQIASGLFAAKYNPLLVFTGAVLALASISTLTIYLGKYFVKILDEKMVSKMASIFFIALGVLTLLNVI